MINAINAHQWSDYLGMYSLNMVGWTLILTAVVWLFGADAF